MSNAIQFSTFFQTVEQSKVDCVSRDSMNDTFDEKLPLMFYSSATRLMLSTSHTVRCRQILLMSAVVWLESGLTAISSKCIIFTLLHQLTRSAFMTSRRVNLNLSADLVYIPNDCITMVIRQTKLTDVRPETKLMLLQQPFQQQHNNVFHVQFFRFSESGEVT